MTTAERIIKLFDDSGREYTDIAKCLGIKPQKISEWKAGKTKSYRNYLDVIAKEFNVTTDYLLNGTIYPKNAEPADLSGMVSIAVYGNVSAGTGAYTEVGAIIGHRAVDTDLLNDGYDYAWLQVKGDSMIGKGLIDGDFVLVRIQEVIDSGDLAVVMVDDDYGVVKEVKFVENEYISLISYNPAYPPRIFVGEDMNRIRIFGKVIKSERDY